MYRLFLMCLLLPSVLTAQVTELRVSRLGDTENNSTSIASFRIRDTIPNAFVGFIAENVSAQDQFGLVSRNQFGVEGQKNLGRLFLNGDMSVVTIPSVGNRFVGGVSAELRHNWQSTNPFGVKVGYNTAPLGIVARQVRTNIEYRSYDVDVDVYVKNSLWLHSNIQNARFSDDNNRQMVTLDVRKYRQNGIFYGVSGFYQGHDFDGIAAYTQEKDIGLGYWAPEAFSSIEGQLGYKIPWRNKTFQGNAFIAGGTQKIDDMSPLRLLKVQGDLHINATNRLKLGIWGNYNNNAVATNVSNYRWWIVNIYTRVTF